MDSLLQNFASQILMQGVNGCKVDVAVQNMTEFMAQAGKTEKPDAGLRVELDDEVDIGGVIGFVSG
jgi:hypothetical protein